MAKEYLDKNGLTYFWGKLKNHFQVKLVSGTNIKTINNTSLLGSGNIDVQGGGGGLTVNDIYPVGSIYMSVNNTDPNVIFAGTQWQSINGRFLVAQGSNGESGDEALNLSAGASGGKKTVTLTAENMPYHRHALGQLTTETYAGFKPSLQVCNVATGSTSTSDNPLTYAGANRGTSGKNNAYTGASNTGGSHSHKLTAGQYTNYAGGSNGAATAHENLPPYLAVYMWKRTA